MPLDRNNLQEPPKTFAESLREIAQQNRNYLNLRDPNTVSPYGSPSRGTLKYDPSIVSDQLNRPGVRYNLTNQQEEQYLPGLYQSQTKRFGNFFGSLFSNLIGEAAHIATLPTDLVDLVATGTQLTNEPIFGWYDNIETFKEKAIDGAFPTYMTKEYAENNLSLWQSLGHAEFWNKEVSSTLAFLVSAYATGGAASSLKLGTRAVQYGVNIEKAIQAGASAEKLKRIANTATTLDNVATIGAQTIYESVAEANHARIDLMNYYQPLIESGEAKIEDVNKRVNEVASRVLIANAALLSLTNMASTNVIKKLSRTTKPSDGITFSRSPYNRVIDETTGAIVDESVRRSAGQLTWEVVKGFTKNYVSESFEEGAQSVFSNTYIELGKSDKINKLGRNVLNDLSAFAVNLSGQLGTNEFNKALILGGVFGGISGGIGSARQYSRDVKNAENIRTNLQNHWNNNIDILQEVTVKDENGKTIYDEKGNPEIDVNKLKDAVSRNIQSTADVVYLNELIENGETDKAQAFYMSRMMAPIINQYINHPRGKELLMTNLRSSLVENGEQEAIEGLPKEIEEQVGKYYDHFEKAHREISPEVIEFLRNKIKKVGYQSKIAKLVSFKNRNRPLLREDLTKDEKKEFEAQLDSFIRNVSYGAVTATARRNILTEELRDLDNEIQQLESELEEAETTEAKNLIKVKLDNRKDSRSQKLDHKAQLESSLAEIFDSNFYNKEFSKFLDIDPNIEYLSRYENQINQAIASLEKEARALGYEFGPADTDELLNSPRSNDITNHLKESVVLRKKDDFYSLFRTPQGLTFIGKIDNDGNVNNIRPVYLAVAEETGYFDGMTMLSKEQKNRIEHLQNIKTQIKGLNEVISEARVTVGLEEELKTIQAIISKTRRKINYAKVDLAKLKEANRPEDAQKIKEYTDNLRFYKEQLDLLLVNRDNIAAELEKSSTIISKYKLVLNSIDSYLNKYKDTTALQVIENPDMLPGLNAIADEFFGLPEVQEVFGKLDNPVVDQASYAKLLDHYYNLVDIARNLNEEITSLDNTIQTQERVIVTGILSNLINFSTNANIPLSAVIDFLDTNVTGSKPLVDLLKVYEANPVNIEEAYNTSIADNPNLYTGVLAGLNLNNLASSFFSKFNNLFTANELNNQVQQALTSLMGYSNQLAVYNTNLNQLADIYESFNTTQREIENIIPMVTYQKEFIETLNRILYKVQDYVNQIATQGYVIDEDSQVNPEPNVESVTERDAFSLRKSAVITTINGITKIRNGKVLYNENGMPILNTEEATFPESMAANAWLNKQDANTFNNTYTLRFASAAQLKTLLEGTNQIVPVTDSTALYVVPLDKSGNVITEDGYVVYFGLPQVKTTFPADGKSTLSDFGVFAQVFQINILDGNLPSKFEFNNKTYDLNKQEDYDTLLSIGNNLLRDRYTTYRTELEQRVGRGEVIKVEPAGLSKGVPVNQRTKNEETGQIENVTRPATDLKSDMATIQVARSPLEANPVTGIAEPAIPGQSSIFLKNGQSVPLQPKTLGEVDNLPETLMKMLAYLGASKNLNATVQFMGMQVPILPNNNQHGLLDMFMVWGLPHTPDKGVMNKNIFISGVGIGNRILTYVSNGVTSQINLQDIGNLNPDGSITIDTNNPKVVSLLEFIKQKSLNINRKALLNGALANGLQIPTDINYQTGVLTTGKKYKSYQDFILQNSEIGIVSENSTMPMYLNRYIILPTQLPPSTLATAQQQQQQPRPAPTVTVPPQAPPQASKSYMESQTENKTINPEVTFAGNSILGTVVMDLEGIEGVGTFTIDTNAVVNVKDFKMFNVGQGGQRIAMPDNTALETQNKLISLLNEGLKLVDKTNSINFVNLKQSVANILPLDFYVEVAPPSQTTPPTPPTEPANQEEDDSNCGTGTGESTKPKGTAPKPRRKQNPK